MKSLREFNKEKQIIIAAHRGDSTAAPENTISAFRNAIAAGADMIETDIYFSSDKKIVIHHNSLVNTEFGRLHIGELELSQIKKIDVCSTISGEFTKEKIPELSELFDLAKGKIYLNLEIKNQTNLNNIEYIEILMNEIYNSGLENQIMLASYCYDMLGAIKKRYPNCPTAGIRIPHHPVSPSELKESIGIDAYICSLSGIRKSISEDAIKNDLVLGAYSIDNFKHFQKAINYKVKAMGSNNPKDIVQLAQSYLKS